MLRITFTLGCVFAFALASYGQKRAYKVIIPNTIMYLSDQPPLKEIKMLSNADTVMFVKEGSRETFQVDYRGTKGYVSKNNLFEVPYSPSIERHTLLPVDQETGKIDFTKVVEVSNITKSELYTRAKQWIAVSFKSANAVIQMDDKEEGILVGKGYAESVRNPDAFVSTVFNFGFTFKVYVKDNKYKYSITDIVNRVPATAYTRPNDIPIEKPITNNKAMRETLIKKVTEMEVSLKSAMNKPVTGKSDW